MARLIDADALMVWLVNMLNEFDDGNDPDEIKREMFLVVLAKTRKMPTVGGWISVKDKLPKSKPDELEYPTVIIALGDGTVELGCYYESTKEWGAGENFDRLRYPVAWMPLPEPPEEDNDAEE